jgi:hypothetical protein
MPGHPTPHIVDDMRMAPLGSSGEVLFEYLPRTEISPGVPPRDSLVLRSESAV